jgi:hypothetical protein
MKPLFVGWQTQGNADNVCVIIEVPSLKAELYHPDDLINKKILVVYGRRNGKLRCKVESWLGNIEVIHEYRYERNYEDATKLYGSPRFIKVREEVKKFLSWEMLKV